MKEDGCQLQRKVIYAEMGNGKNRRHNSLFLMHISHPYLVHMPNMLLCKIVRKTEKSVIYLTKLIQ